MISVMILINGKAIMGRSAINLSPEGKRDDEVHTYHVDDGRVIKMRRDAGAVELAMRMLRGIKEAK